MHQGLETIAIRKGMDDSGKYGFRVVAQINHAVLINEMAGIWHWIGMDYPVAARIRCRICLYGIKNTIDQHLRQLAGLQRCINSTGGSKQASGSSGVLPDADTRPKTQQQE
jgi:hypothetical protein